MSNTVYSTYQIHFKTPEGEIIKSGLQITIIDPATGAEATLYSDQGVTSLANSITDTVFDALIDGTIDFYTTLTSVDILVLNTTTKQSHVAKGVTTQEGHIIFDQAEPSGDGDQHNINAVSSVEYLVPAAMYGMTTTVVTMATDQLDDAVLGAAIIMSGAVDTTITIPDIGTAVAGRKTALVNRGGASIVTVRTDTTNTLIDGVDGEVTIADGGWLILQEVVADMFSIYDSHLCTLTADA